MSIPWQLISQSLFELDPMNTCCKENDCFDEYDFVARHIADKIVEGLLPERAICMSLMQLFDESAAKSADIRLIIELFKAKQGDTNV